MSEQEWRQSYGYNSKAGGKSCSHNMCAAWSWSSTGLKWIWFTSPFKWILIKAHRDSWPWMFKIIGLFFRSRNWQGFWAATQANWLAKGYKVPTSRNLPVWSCLNTWPLLQTKVFIAYLVNWNGCHLHPEWLEFLLGSIAFMEYISLVYVAAITVSRVRYVWGNRLLTFEIWNVLFRNSLEMKE